MMNTNNSYFEEIERISNEWMMARSKRMNCKKEIIKTLG